MDQRTIKQQQHRQRRRKKSPIESFPLLNFPPSAHRATIAKRKHSIYTHWIDYFDMVGITHLLRFPHHARNMAHCNRWVYVKGKKSLRPDSVSCLLSLKIIAWASSMHRRSVCMCCLMIHMDGYLHIYLYTIHVFARVRNYFSWFLRLSVFLLWGINKRSSTPIESMSTAQKKKRFLWRGERTRG